jgi:hypothetical protein
MQVCQTAWERRRIANVPLREGLASLAETLAKITEASRAHFQGENITPGDAMGLFSDSLTVGPRGSGADYETTGTNDETVINGCIDDAVAAGISTVKLAPGTYYLDDPVTLRSGTRLVGAGKTVTKLVITGNYDSSSHYYVIGAMGTMTPTATDLTVNATQGSTVLTFASGGAAGIAVGDYLFLTSNALWETTNLSGRMVGEYVEVLAVTDTTVTVSSMVRDDYLVSDIARFYRVQFVEDCGVQDLQVYQQAALNTRTGNPPALVGMTLTRNFRIENCLLHDNDGPGITIHHCLDGVVDRTSLYRLTSNPGANRYGYACLIGGASERIIVNGNPIGSCRHAVDAGPSKAPAGVPYSNRGVSRGVVVSGNNVMNTTDAAMSTHSECDGWLFANNTVSRCNGAAFHIRGRGARVIGNAIEWCGQGINVGNATIDTQGGSAAGSHILNNSMRYMKALASSGALGVGITLGLTDKVVVKGNIITECDRAGIMLKSGACHSIIEENTLVDCNLANFSGSVSEGINIEANKNGTGATLTAASGTMTLTRSGAGFSAMHVGKTVTISAANNAANLGAFTVLTAAGDSLTYANGSGATDTGVAYQVEGSTDNVFRRNTVRNTPASRYARGSVGRAQYIARDYGTVNGNARNTFIDNVGIGMTLGLLRVVSGVAYTELRSTDGGGKVVSSNEKTTRTEVALQEVTTTAATVTAVYTHPTTANRTYRIRGQLTGQDATNSVTLSYDINVFAANVSGAASVGVGSGSTVSVIEKSDAGAGNATVAASGANLIVRAPGYAGKTVRWRLTNLVIDEGGA